MIPTSPRRPTPLPSAAQWSFPAEQAKILDALYVDLGLTRMRWHPEGSVAGVGEIEPVNDNSDPDVTDLSKFNFAWRRNDGHIDHVKAIRPRGVTIFFRLTAHARVLDNGVQSGGIRRMGDRAVASLARPWGRNALLPRS